MSHSPDVPFGCTVAFGPVGGYGPVHICNMATDHGGVHRCKCDATAAHGTPGDWPSAIAPALTRVWYTEREWYPVYEPDPDHEPDDDYWADVPAELAERWQRSHAEFDKANTEISWYIDARRYDELAPHGQRLVRERFPPDGVPRELRGASEHRDEFAHHAASSPSKRDV